MSFRTDGSSACGGISRPAPCVAEALQDAEVERMGLSDRIVFGADVIPTSRLSAQP